MAAPLMPDPQPAAASGSGRLLQASALPLAHPAPGAGEVDWMPMHSRMQMAAASVSTITIQQSNEVGDLLAKTFPAGQTAVWLSLPQRK